METISKLRPIYILSCNPARSVSAAQLSSRAGSGVSVSAVAGVWQGALSIVRGEGRYAGFVRRCDTRWQQNSAVRAKLDIAWDGKLKVFAVHTVWQHILFKK